MPMTPFRVLLCLIWPVVTGCGAVRPDAPPPATSCPFSPPGLAAFRIATTHDGIVAAARSAVDVHLCCRGRRETETALVLWAVEAVRRRGDLARAQQAAREAAPGDPTGLLQAAAAYLEFERTGNVEFLDAVARSPAPPLPFVVAARHARSFRSSLAAGRVVEAGAALRELGPFLAPDTDPARLAALDPRESARQLAQSLGAGDGAAAPILRALVPALVTEDTLALVSRHYWVNAGGDAAEAARRVDDGGVLHLGEGVIRGPIRLDDRAGVAVRGCGPARTVLECAGDSAPTVRFWRCRQIALQGLSVRCACQSDPHVASAVVSLSEVLDARLEQVEIGGGTHGLLVKNSSGLVADALEVRRTAAAGIIVNGTRGIFHRTLVQDCGSGLTALACPDLSLAEVALVFSNDGTACFLAQSQVALRGLRIEPARDRTLKLSQVHVVVKIPGEPESCTVNRLYESVALSEWCGTAGELASRFVGLATDRDRLAAVQAASGSVACRGREVAPLLRAFQCDAVRLEALPLLVAGIIDWDQPAARRRDEGDIRAAFDGRCEHQNTREAAAGYLEKKRCSPTK